MAWHSSPMTVIYQQDGEISAIMHVHHMQINWKYAEIIKPHH